jgi:tetratricopeptide (TPR) repeat protein
VAHLQFERGDTAKSIATLHSLLALEQDPRRPSSLGPMMGYRWLELATLQAETGDAKAAAQSMKSYARDTGEFAAQLGAHDPKRALFADHKLQGGNLQLAEGAPQTALATATAAVAEAEQVKIPPTDTVGINIQVSMLRANLSVAARAATQLGQYARAEKLARRWLRVPTNPISLSDPRAATSAARVVLAQAIAMQGRGDEARKALQPALAYYEGEQKAGADGTTFRHDYAYALYVSAIAAPGDAAGRKQRDAALSQAAGVVAGASKEAQQLADMRNTASLIAVARATPAS